MGDGSGNDMGQGHRRARGLVHLLASTAIATALVVGAAAPGTAQQDPTAHDEPGERGGALPWYQRTVLAHFPDNSSGKITWGAECYYDGTWGSGYWRVQAQMLEIGNSRVSSMRLRWGLAAAVDLPGLGTFRLGQQDYQWLAGWPSAWSPKTFVLSNTPSKTWTPVYRGQLSTDQFPLGYEDLRLVVQYRFDRFLPRRDSVAYQTAAICRDIGGGVGG